MKTSVREMRHGSSARWRVVALACCMALPGAALADVTVTPAEKGYDIDITGDASSSDLIDAIVSATGVAIKGEPDDKTLTVNHLKATSLERALRMLLPGANFAVRFNADGAPSEIIFLTTGPGDGASDTAVPGGADAGPQDAPTDAGGTADYGAGDDQSSQ